MKKIFLKFDLGIILLVIILLTRGIFTTNNLLWLFLILFGFAWSIILTPVCIYIAQRYGIVDSPGGRKTHLDATPLLGGLAVYFSFCAVVFFNLYYPDDFKALFLATSFVLFISLLDDIYHVSSKIRLLVHGIATAVLIYNGIQLTIFGGSMIGQIFNYLFTFLWIIGITNALNFFDGMDGLAAGIGSICAIFLGIVSIQTGQYLLMLLSFSLAGSCLGFLLFNFRFRRPASIFLGDAGATFIGFTLAGLSIMSEWDVQGSIKTFSMPLLIFGLLIYDSIYIFSARFLTGKVETFSELLDYSAHDHLHHRLNALGLTVLQTVLFIYLLAAILGLSAVILKNGRIIDVLLSIIQMSLTLLCLTVIMKKGGDSLKRVRHQPQAADIANNKLPRKIARMDETRIRNINQ